VNAIGMLADALAVRSWSGTQAGNMADFVAEMIGTGFYAERFGDLAYADEFMGPLTAAPTLLQVADDKTLSLDINLRRPRGRTGADVEQLIRTAVDAWSTKHAVTATVATQLEEPWVQEYAPHVPVLLNVFSVFTGTKDAKPIAIGGATNSRLFPAAVSFGPTMPGHVYSGHSEHEFISEEQLLLNLQMYTAALVELAR
jgi:dipeptidase D